MNKRIKLKKGILHKKCDDKCVNYRNNNEKEFIKVLECIGKYGLTPVFNAIAQIQQTCPTNISTDKIEFICALKDDNKVLYLEDYNDDIMKNSVNMLSEFNTLL